MRIDKYLAENGLAKSREVAQKLIKEGSITLDGKIITKPSFDVDEGIKPNIEIIGVIPKYVSRGGLKLEKALDFFNIDVEGLEAIDIGASTGGFTDCLLQRNIGKVLCVDVGSSQLDKSIEKNQKVTSLEKVNARYLTAEKYGQFDLAVCDVSFISLTLIFPSVRSILKPDGKFIALIKPQFEAGKSNIGKNGIVKDRAVWLEVIKKVIISAEENGLYAKGLTSSPILGGDGNREFLCVFDSSGGLDEKAIANVVFDKSVL